MCVCERKKKQRKTNGYNNRFFNGIKIGFSNNQITRRTTTKMKEGRKRLVCECVCVIY